jgi:hypothetical protein
VPVFTVALAVTCWFASVWQMRGMGTALAIVAFGVLVVVVPSTFSV